MQPSNEQRGAAGRQRFFSRVAQLSDSVFRSHPEIVDHRREFPWLTACLGDPFAKAWFVAENPSLTPVRVSRATSPEHQWSGGRGADLLREMLAKHGFKTGGPFAAGGWRCYITDVIKSAAVVKEWNALPAESHKLIAEAWAPVLRYELEIGQPELLVVLGAKAERLLVHLERERLLPRLPPLKRIHHYSYIAVRPDAQRGLGPGHPQRVAEWDAEFSDIANIVGT